MCVYCVYAAMSKGFKKTSTAKLPENSRNKRCSSSVMVSSIASAFLLFPFLIVALHASGNRKAISF